MNKLLLNLVMLPSGFWRGMGADSEQLKAILDIRLKMDDRKPFGIGRRQNQRKKIKSSLLSGIFISVLMGVVYSIFSYVPDLVFSLTIYFGYVLLWLCLMLITDFSNVLFDQRDKYILLPRPINDKTLVLSKLLHIFIYLFRIVIPLVIPEWIYLGYTRGWTSVLLFPLVVLLTLFIALFLVNSCYLFILKFAATKFKEIINYFQIAASVVFFAAIYLRPRSFDAETHAASSILDYQWIKYSPTYWLAVIWHYLGAPVLIVGSQWLAILALVLPLLCLLLIVKWLAPQFSRNISLLDVSETKEENAPLAKASVSVSQKPKYYQVLVNLVNKSESAKAGFIITWLQTSRSRSFKMRVFPSFAYVPVYFFYMLMSNGQSLSHAWKDMPSGPAYLILLYMCSFVMMNAMNYLYISDQYKAAWVYYAAPLKTPGKVLSGSFKALWIKYLLPFFLVLSVFIVAFWGWQTILDIVLAVVNVTLFAICMIRVGARHFPFSASEQINKSGYRVLRAFLSMFLVFILGFGHFFLVKFDVLGLSIVLKCIFLLLSSGFMYLVWNSYTNTSWLDIQKAELQ